MFGKLTVLKLYTTVKKGLRIGTYYKCACACGKTIISKSTSLTNGVTKSCGCDKDLTGKKFGLLTVIEEGHPTKNNVRRWKCLCECGNITFSERYNLVHGYTKSCRCYGRNDLTGKKFGRLTAIKKLRERKDTSIIWLCLCDCGEEVKVKACNLKSGNTKSCGCLRYEAILESLRKRGPIEYPKKSKHYRNLEKHIFRSYKGGAKDRGFSFNLSFEEFTNFLYKNCFYCGSPPIRKFKLEDSEITYSGIDRMDSKKGYALTNCVSCCFTCNKAKNKLPIEEFITWGLRIGDFLSKQKKN